MNSRLDERRQTRRWDYQLGGGMVYGMPNRIRLGILLHRGSLYKLLAIYVLACCKLQLHCRDLVGWQSLVDSNLST